MKAGLLAAAVTISAAPGIFVCDVEAKEETWAIYWYLCGSDLETNYGCATADLEEALSVELPDHIQLVIQTGGSEQWQNETMEAEYLERYVYAEGEFACVEQLESANMGEEQTLTEFLEFCTQNYPADKEAVIFWNHGGGSTGGVAYDEIYGYDSLMLDEIYSAFASVYELSKENPPLEFVGFDACLMATVDTAYTFNDIAKYMIASEETEPGYGWSYDGWLSALAENPSMDGAQVGRYICDTYQEACDYMGEGDEITLSVVDLSKTDALLLAYDSMGEEALAYACADPVFFSEFGRCASAAENYGGNTPDEGYTNLVDMKSLVENSEYLFPENGENVLQALEDCVIYKVSGPYKKESGGLSCYYSYDGDAEQYEIYSDLCASESFSYLYGYELTGELPQEGMDYISDWGYEELQEIPSLDEEQDYPVSINEDGYAEMDLGAETANYLKGVYFNLAYVDMEDDFMMLLGRDNDIVMDWENGIFTDNFRGVWGSIDGCLCYMDIVYEGEDYNLYSVPVLLNGEEYNLRVAYDYNEEDYFILGARKGLDDNGMSDRNLVQLKPGDEVTTLHYGGSISGEMEDMEQVEVDTIVVTEDTCFEEIDMGDGEFVMMFEMVDAANQTTYSEMIFFTVLDGEIFAEV